MQLDEFASGDEAPFGILPVCVLVDGDPRGVAQEGTARVGSCLPFYYFVQPVIICDYGGYMVQAGF